ncbi:MAG: DMT family transporter, partial [Anaerolineae bacterium]|nr:DMT family transporter [Anaerolineae bacterium]
ALLTSLAFSIGPALFTLAGRQVGSVVVNRSRLVFAVIMLSTAHWILLGTPLPLAAGTDRWMWFTLSGVIGLTLGDAALFQAFLMLGTRLTMLVFSISPLLSALAAWWLFGETLTPLQLLGVFITLAGVAWVVSEKRNANSSAKDTRHYRTGILLALIAALGQTIGLITAKYGLEGGFPALSGVWMRMFTGMIAIWVWTALVRQVRPTIRTLRDNPASMKFLLLASLTGPFFGVWMSLVAIQHAKIGIASTLMSLPPLFLIPIGRIVFSENITPRSLLGTLIAIAGVAVLFLA